MSISASLLLPRSALRWVAVLLLPSDLASALVLAAAFVSASALVFVSVSKLERESEWRLGVAAMSAT